MDASYLAHHGVKGMKWGVWNDETKRKYGVTTLPKGTEIRRITNREEAKNFDFKRSIYATMNDEDFKKYAAVANGLPSLFDSSKGKASILTMRLKEDAAYADGEAAIKLALEEALGQDISEFSKSLEETAALPDVVYAYDHWVDEYKKKYGNATMQSVIDTKLSDIDPDKVRAAERVIHVAVTGSVGSYAFRPNQNTYLDKAKKRGYDILTDPEDWTQNEMDFIKDVKAPLIVIDPSKTLETNFKVKNTTVRKLRKQGR